MWPRQGKVEKHLLIILFIVIALCAVTPQVVDEAESGPKWYDPFRMVEITPPRASMNCSHPCFLRVQTHSSGLACPD
jgi:hypothetical protein